MYGLNKLYLLMEKQHNRGQEGAGAACVKLQAHPGEELCFAESRGTQVLLVPFCCHESTNKTAANGK